MEEFMSVEEATERCAADGMKQNGLCGLARDEHEDQCPVCRGYGEYEGEYGPRACMPCVTGLGPHGHKYRAAAKAPTDA